MPRNPAGIFPREIYALFFVRLVVSAGSFVNPFLAMLLTMKLGYDEAAAGAFMSAVSAVSAAGLLLGGKLGDTLGRKSVLGTLQAITAGAYAVCALVGFSPAMPFIIAFALGALSGTWPILNAVVADTAPLGRRKEAFALLYWGNNIGFSLGSLASGFLFTRAPRMLFVGNAVALSAAALIVFSFIRETKPLAAENTGTLRVLFRDPTLVIFSLISVLTAFVYNQHVFALPLFLKDVLGPEKGPKAFGFAMATNGLTVVIFSVAVAALSRRVPSLLAAAAGSLLYALGFGSYALAGGLFSILACTFVWTQGEILGNVNNNAFIAERAPATHRGRINSAVTFCFLIGNALAPLVVGPAMKILGSRAIWIPVGILAGIGGLGLTALYLYDRQRGPGRVVRSS